MWTNAASLDLHRQKQAYFQHGSYPGSRYHDVETTGYCADDVDGLWMPSHESNQRSNYNYH